MNPYAIMPEPDDVEKTDFEKISFCIGAIRKTISALELSVDMFNVIPELKEAIEYLYDIEIKDAPHD